LEGKVAIQVLRWLLADVLTVGEGENEGDEEERSGFHQAVGMQRHT
jgi:hypothetical protein